MKAIVSTLVLCVMIDSTAMAEEATQPLAAIASRVLKEGTDARMNGRFATALGIARNQASVSLKRVAAEVNGATNVFNVSFEDKKTIILSVREKQLTTFYLTDLSGKLKRVMINDSSLQIGGLTNIPVATAQRKFEQQKDWWVKKHFR